jgi:transcriptional regulator with XRE-family HTH domain
MAGIRYISHEEGQEEDWKDPEYRHAYRLLKPRYDILREIVRLRHRLGITQEELAEKASTHQSRVSKIESAEYDVRLSTLIQLADALNADVQIQLITRIPQEEYKEIHAFVAESSTQTWPLPASPKLSEEKVFA